jgi:hypothetical protein
MLTLDKNMVSLKLFPRAQERCTRITGAQSRTYPEGTAPLFLDAPAA